ncbi:Rv3235 family protein [Arthrobacter sp. U41]|uniref:Rv3235 family protein n=1 Tax=Arthrobacter sp. U41 TaxID=1849032 RepID=UPI0009F69470|nr:Rv3235 family protein [Arthrobacter sp. U41]
MSAMTSPRAAAEAPVSTAPPLRLVPGGAEPPGRPAGSPAPPAQLLGLADEERQICAISRSTVQAAIEVLAGTRPAQQLARRLDERCLCALQHRAALTRRVPCGASPTAGRLHRNASVRSVRACRVSADVYEASAVVVEELRVRAVALRLERSRLTWRVTVLEIG